MDRGAWQAIVHGVARVRHDLATSPPPPLACFTVASVIKEASLVAQMVKNLPAMQETWVWSLGWEDPLEKGMATHSSSCLGNPMDRGTWQAPIHGVQRVGHDWVTNNLHSLSRQKNKVWPYWFYNGMALKFIHFCPLLLSSFYRLWIYSALPLLLSFLKIYFNWRIITILWFFCHTSEWIGHRNTWIPCFPPPSPPRPSGLSQSVDLG